MSLLLIELSCSLELMAYCYWGVRFILRAEYKILEDYCEKQLNNLAPRTLTIPFICMRSLTTFKKYIRIGKGNTISDFIIGFQRKASIIHFSKIFM
jgi:hypothetical protein